MENENKDKTLSAWEEIGRVMGTAYVEIEEIAKSNGIEWDAVLSYIAESMGITEKKAVASDARLLTNQELIEHMDRGNAPAEPKFTGKFAGLNDIIGSYGQTDGERLKELLQYMRMQYEHEENKRTGKYTGAFEGLNNIII